MIRSFVVLAITGWLALAPAPAAARSAAAHDPVSFNGAWWPKPGTADFKPDPLLTPSAQVTWDDVHRELAQGHVVLDSTAACIPPGTPRLMTRVYPIQWVRYDKGYAVIHEYENEVRWIFMDGRNAPVGDDLIPTFNGYSVGRWEGDALVVETAGFKPQSEGGWPVWIQMGVRVTAQLKLIERYRLAEGGKVLEVQMTMTDPSTLAQPWITSKRFDLRPDVDIMEFTCLPDENVVTFKSDGSTTFKGLSQGAPK